MEAEIKQAFARIESALRSMAYLAPECARERRAHQQLVAGSLNEIATLAGLVPVQLEAKEHAPC